MGEPRNPAEGRRDTAVLVPVVLLLALPFVVGATHADFWAGWYAPLATLLTLAVIVALVLRHRWAWWLVVALEAFAVVSAPFDFAGWPATVLNIITLALLLSPPMRRRLRPPRRAAPSAAAALEGHADRE